MTTVHSDFSARFGINNGTISDNKWQAYLHWWGTASSCWKHMPQCPPPWLCHCALWMCTKKYCVHHMEDLNCCKAPSSCQTSLLCNLSHKIIYYITPKNSISDIQQILLFSLQVMWVTAPSPPITVDMNWWCIFSLSMWWQDSLTSHPQKKEIILGTKVMTRWLWF